MLETVNIFLTPLMNSPFFRFLIRHDITVAASVIDQRPITDFPRDSLPRSTFKMISHHLKRLRLALIYSTRLRRTTELNPTQTDRHKSMLLFPHTLESPSYLLRFRPLASSPLRHLTLLRCSVLRSFPEDLLKLQRTHSNSRCHCWTRALISSDENISIAHPFALTTFSDIRTVTNTTTLIFLSLFFDCPS